MSCDPRIPTTSRLTPCLLLLVPMTATAAADESTDTRDPRAVLSERLVVLERLADLRRQAFERGEVAFDAVLDAERTVLEARLELAESREARLEIRTRVLRIASDAESLVRRHVEARAAPRTDLLRATAFRLRAEADLLLERRRTN